MEFKGIKVLVLDGHSRQSLPMIKAFNKLGCEVSALCTSKLDVAYNSKYTHHKILRKYDKENEEIAKYYLIQLIESNKYDVVVPLIDFSAHLLSKYKNEISKYTRVAANDYSIYNLAGDKLKTMEICMNNQIPCPKTLIGINCVEDIINSDMCFPIVIKPRVGYGAIGFKILNTKEELMDIINKIDINEYVFQEYISQKDIQYECAMFIDSNNEVKTSCVFSKNRWFPINGGSSTLNITVDRKDIIESCTKLLKIINWRGPADIDLIQDPKTNTAKIMEINPRVSGSVKITFIAEVNQAQQILELAFNESVTSYIEYKFEKRLRCSQTDLLWFIKSPNRFKANPSWFSNKNTYDQIFSFDDPKPYFSFTLQKIKSYRRDINKRK